MSIAAVPVDSPVARRRVPALPRPSRRRLGAGVLGLLALMLASAVGSTAAYLEVPAPTGMHGVGRTGASVVDPIRTESGARGGGARVVRLTAWYPAVKGSGVAAPYVPDLQAIRAGLEASGELGPFVAGLGLVRTAARDRATPVDTGASYPVVLLDPGNATNAAFYAALAEDLASRGVAVIGVDHPYQSAAVDLGDGRVAVYREETRLGDGGASIAARIDERVADLRLVLDRLGEDAAGLPGLAGRLDTDRIAVVGHSNGGLAAVAMCARDARVDACVNVDGQQLGGPFAATAEGAATPTKPFLYLTKEPVIAPAWLDRFEEAGDDTYRVVVAAATHDAFTDGARLRPRLLPVDGDPDAVLATQRQVVGTFLDRYLRPGAPASFAVFDPPTDVSIEIYPLRAPEP